MWSLTTNIFYSSGAGKSNDKNCLMQNIRMVDEGFDGRIFWH